MPKIPEPFFPVDLLFPSHPKTLKLKRLAGKAAPGHLILLWMWASGNRPDGNLRGMEDEDVEAAADWSGQAGRFTIALLESRYLEGSSGSYALHDWDYWQDFFAGQYARRKEAERKARQRDKIHDVPPLSQQERDKTRTERDLSIEEKRGDKEEKDQNLRSPRPPKPRRSRSDQHVDPAFDAFWNAYPRKVAKLAARKAWLKINPQNGLGDAITDAVLLQKTWPSWQRDGGQYIPHATTWLNQHRWEDQPPEDLTETARKQWIEYMKAKYPGVE